MKETINTELVRRIWDAEKELHDAICAAREDGIVTEIDVVSWISGTQVPVIRVKQLLFP